MKVTELESEALVGDIQLINNINHLSILQEKLPVQIGQEKLFSGLSQLDQISFLKYLLLKNKY